MSENQGVRVAKLIFIELLLTVKYPSRLGKLSRPLRIARYFQKASKGKFATQEVVATPLPPVQLFDPVTDRVGLLKMRNDDGNGEHAMRVLINTNYNPKLASVRICVNEMSERFRHAGYEVTLNDWVNYSSYDLILFMGFDSKVKEAKLANPRALVGIMSAYIFEEWQIENSRVADFLLADSIEHRERLLEVNRNIFIYYMFPEMAERLGENSGQSGKVIIGYHGSRTHMIQARGMVRALDRLAQKYEIELWAVYNIEGYGKWERNLPKNCPVRHIQWSDESISEYLSKSDIGVLPGTIPINRSRGLKTSRFLSTFANNWLFYSHTDYLIRFKLPTNPGRLYPYSRFGIPVVAEFVPSFSQFIQDGESGHLVGGEEGWYRALESLILDPEARVQMGTSLKKYVDVNHSPGKIFHRFLSYVADLSEEKHPPA